MTDAVKIRFRNHYTCPECQHTWTDVWDSMCDDDCPNCGRRHISPMDSDDLTPGLTALEDINAIASDGLDGRPLTLDETIFLLKEIQSVAQAALGSIEEDMSETA